MTSSSVLIRPNSEVYHSRIHGTIFELESPWWPLTPVDVSVSACKPAQHIDAVTVRWLNDDEKIATPTRPTEKPTPAGPQIVMVGGVDGARYTITVGSLHFYVRVVPERP